LLKPGQAREWKTFYDSDADTGLRFRPQLPTDVGVEGELQGRVDEQVVFSLKRKGRGKRNTGQGPLTRELTSATTALLEARPGHLEATFQRHLGGMQGDERQGRGALTAAAS